MILKTAGNSAAITILRPRFKNILEALLVFPEALPEMGGSLATKYSISPPPLKKKYINIKLFWLCGNQALFSH